MEPRPIIAATLDQSAGVGYLKFSTNKVVRTDEFDETTLVDLDEFDMVVGFELLDLAAQAPHLKELRERYHIPQAALDYLTELEAIGKARGARVRPTGTSGVKSGVKYGSVAARRKTPC